MKVRFEFHKVGQGLFYTGKIGEFNFVYDCGSKQKNPLVDAIRSYKSNFHERGMDMLIISHFHSDHVSGLDYLLQNIGVADVLIPYFTPLERLIVALRWSNLPKWYSKWYYEFLRDPVSYFLDRGARRVIIVGGPREYRPSSSEEVTVEDKIRRYEKPSGKHKIPRPEEKTDIHKMPDNSCMNIWNWKSKNS
ncbi:MAG: MBL fold metallo-hydrolase [Theionarchaea archaeon]|nr:MBL fold metallo-hydrolase [Theionarchaea archaeon]